MAAKLLPNIATISNARIHVEAPDLEIDHGSMGAQLRNEATQVQIDDSIVDTRGLDAGPQAPP